MQKRIEFLFLGLLIFGCNSSNTSTESKTTIVDGTTRYEVYQSSEMSALMKAMHSYNTQLKAQILDDEVTLEFPEAFENIDVAQLSDGKSRTQAFDHYSGKFIEAQKAIFEEDSTVSIKDRYNNAITMCLSCHQTECTGPIPKIKKLLIK